MLKLSSEETERVSEEKEDKALILKVLREVALTGSDTVKVQAVTQMAAIYGMAKGRNKESVNKELIELMKDFAEKVGR